ncbi:MAG: hypothetical protein KAH54_04505 [Candidatus Sabulitectum sp.]|nr:hypothetical protein [Candidatus Sabulitectum sp.]
MDTASLVIGIVAAIIGFIPCLNLFVIVPAIVGLILGIVSFRKRSAEELPTGIALTGIILNALPLVVMTAFLILAMVTGDSYTVNEMIIK